MPSRSQGKTPGRHNSLMDTTRNDVSAELAQAAACLVVEEGMEYAAAKRRAVKQLGLSARTALPDNATIDAAVRDYIALFCADTQPAELAALRTIALTWMERLDAFRPHLGGAVWRGTATRHSDVYLQLFCDDPKAPEWALLNHRVAYHPGEVKGWRGEPVPVLTLRVRCEELGQWALVHLMLHDLDDLRGALRPDAQGRKPRGDVAATRRLLASEPSKETV
jgi:hypothetical protein